MMNIDKVKCAAAAGRVQVALVLLEQAAAIIEKAGQDLAGEAAFGLDMHSTGGRAFCNEADAVLQLGRKLQEAAVIAPDMQKILDVVAVSTTSLKAEGERGVRMTRYDAGPAPRGLRVDLGASEASAVNALAQVS